LLEAGQLLIKVWKHDYDLIDETALGPQESTTVKPGEYHRFEVTEKDTVAYEIYWTELDSEDIAREDHGGILGQENT